MTKPISHLRALCELAIIFALGFLAIVLMVFATGCKSPRFTGIDDAAKGTQRVYQRFDSIQDAAAQALPDSGTASPLVAFIGQQAVAGKVDTKAVDSALATAQKQAEELQAKYDKLSGNRWVQAGLWCQRAFWTILIAIIGVNVFVAASPLFGGWAVSLGKNIVRLGSIVGPGAFVREAQLKKKGQP